MEINITILVQLIAFLFLLAWLSKFLFTPLMRLISEREARIKGAKSEAVIISQKAHRYQREIEVRVYENQKKARLEMALLKAQGIEEYRKIIDRAKGQARKKLKKARSSLVQEVEKIKESLRGDVSRLTKEVLKKMMSKKFGVRSFTLKNDMDC